MGAQLSYGRFNTLDVDAFVSGPLSSTLKARLAIKSVSGDEWQKSYTRNDKLGKLDNIAGRLLLDWDPTERVKFSLNINGWRDQNDPLAPQQIAITAQNAVGAAGLGGVLSADFPALTYPNAPANARAADWTPTNRPYANTKFGQIALRADYEVLDDLNITSLTSYDRMHFLKDRKSTRLNSSH